MDGWVTIGTKLDTKDFDIKYEKLSRDVEKKELNIDIKTQQAEQTKRELESINRQLEETENELSDISEKAERFSYLEFKGLDKLTQQENFEYAELSMQNIESEEQKILNNLTRLESQQSKLNVKLKEQNSAIDDAKFKYVEAQQKFTAYKNEVDKADFSKIKNSLNGIGNSISGIIKKVGRWALAVFGIRSAYLFVRQAMSTLSQYNEQIASDVEYIRFALATALQPVIEYIIQLAYKLLSIIGYIANAWFGVNIFANSSAKAFEKNKKAISGANKSAKELKKTLAGFDEMNILQDTDTSGGGGGAGGTTLPTFDLSNLEEPDWSAIYSWTDKLRDIFNNTFEKIKKNVKKVMESLGFSPGYIKAWELFVDGVKTVLNGLISVIKGVLQIITGLISGDVDLVKQGIETLVKGIGTILLGLVKTVGGVFNMIISALYNALIKPITDAINKLNEVVFQGFFSSIINWAGKAWNGIKQAFANMPSWFSGIIGGILNNFKSFGTTLGNAIGSAFKTVINGVLAWIEAQLNRPIDAINGLLNVVSKVGINIGRISRIRLPRLAKGGIINMPGKGVPVGSALAGERGAEGVIPLTDSQQMALLGEAIGKYIVVNANITNTMNGRVISRELQRINNESDFAFNR